MFKFSIVQSFCNLLKSTVLILHGSNTVLLNDKCQNDWEFEMDIMDEPDYGRILSYGNTPQVYLGI